MKRNGFLLGAAVSILSLAVATYAFGGDALGYLPVRLAWLAGASVLGGFFLRGWSAAGSRAPWSWGLAIGLSAALAGCAHVALSYVSDISTYPLTIGWSETSRYYYASLFFARSIYGTEAPPTVLHPSRYLLQAIPFLLPGSPLWLHRAWQVFLWLFMPAVTAASLARRLGLASWLEKVALSAVVFLLLMSGPIYYHLLPPAILILLGFHRPAPDQGWRAWLKPLAVLVLASAWAGISRINWFPVPAMLAVALILMEDPLQSAGPPADAWRSAWREWRMALPYLLIIAGLGVLGSLTALGAQALYILWSGNSAEQFTTSFSSDLLWSRLLPNVTYPPGIFLAIVLVSLPTLLAIWARLFPASGEGPGWRGYHPLRLLGLAAMLLILFAGGLVVSIKIGGGSNIHNMDAYLVLMVIVGATFYFGRVKPEYSRALGQSDSLSPVTGSRTGARRWSLLSITTLLALLIPAAFAVLSRGPAGPLPDPATARQAVQIVSEAARQVAKQGSPVLFISNRHLLTFHQIKGVGLVPEYERVFLMEVAMARDPDYLKHLYADLKSHRFGLIVSEPLSRQQKGADEVFGAENDVWVKQVARQILCYYEPVRTLRPVQIQLLAPRAEPDPACP